MIIDDDDEKIVWPRKTTMRMIDADETHRLVQKKTYERHRANLGKTTKTWRVSRQ